MSFRRALLISGGVLVVLAIIFFSIESYSGLPNNLSAIAFLVGILSFVAGFRHLTEVVQKSFTRQEPVLDPREYDYSSPQALRHRENLLNHVRHVWIEGQNAFLEHAIHRKVMIELGWQYDQQAVGDEPPLNRLLSQPPPDPSPVSRPNRLISFLNPLKRLLLQAQRDPTPIPASQTIADVYRENGRSLLILGAPGSGKTITLLRLAEALLAEAVADESTPAPMIVPLASWANQRLPLIDWLAEEMFLQYQIGRKLSRQWLQNSRLVLLLDGLDEVAAAHREACVAAINTFRDEHPCEMVVTSRSEDYAQLAETLRLNTAVELQPLTPPEMHGYLSRFGDQMQPVRDMLDNDEKFRQLAQTPLMLTLFPLAYDRNTTSIPTTGTQAERRQHLFHTYLQRALKRRPLQAPYTVRNALDWLRNLANLMTTHDQTPFYLENMQPTWLSNQRGYRWGLRLAVLLISAILSGLVVGLSDGLISGLGVGLSIGIGFVGKVFWEPLPVSRWLNFLKPLRGGLIFGLSMGFIFGLISELSDRLIVGLIFALIVGLIFGLVGGLNGLVDASKIILTEKLKIKYEKSYIIQTIKVRMQQELIFGLIFGLIVRPLSSIVRESFGIGGLSFGLIVGLIVGLSFGLIGGLSEGIMGEAQSNDLSEKAIPNQGIWLSRRNGLRMGLIGMIRDAIVFGGLSSLLLGFFGSGFVSGALSGGSLGAAIGFLGGFWDYGLAVVQHYIVRWLLRDKLPYPLRDKKLAAYLDGFVERLVLQRVGGGWRFVHRELQEHVAGLSDEQLDELAASLSPTAPS